MLDMSDFQLKQYKVHPTFDHLGFQPEVIQQVIKAISYPVWLTDYQQALTAATIRHMLVLAAFSGYSWCSHCLALKQEVFDSGQFGLWAISHSLVLLDIDVPAQPKSTSAETIALLQQYQVSGYPTVIGMNADGTERGRAVGYSTGMGIVA